MLILLPFVVLFALLLIRTPVAFSLAISGAFGILINSSGDAALGILQTVPYRAVSHYTLLTIPLFILMAQLAVSSGMADDIFDGLHKWLGRVPGGTAIATVLAGAGLAVVSGSSAASAGALSKSAVPPMLRHGYSKPLALGTVSAVGTLAIMIPPSNGLILYAIITENSIGAMLIAGVLPGILIALAFVCLVVYLARREPAVRRASIPHSLGEKLSSLRSFWPIPVLSVAILGGIYSGAVTVVEAAALGAFLMLCLVVLVGRATVSSVIQAFTRTTYLTSMIFFLIMGAKIFGYFLSMTQVTTVILESTLESGMSRWVLLAVVLLILMVLGAFMDQTAILVLTLPVLYPVLMTAGYDPIWFGIIFTSVAELGLLTPPLGLNVYVASGAVGARVEDGFRGVWPFCVTHVALLLVFIAVPDIALWLPSLMGN